MSQTRISAAHSEPPSGLSTITNFFVYVVGR